MNKHVLRRLEAAEMKFLRSLAGYALKDRQKNEAIREELGGFKLMGKIAHFEEIGMIMSVGWIVTESLLEI